MKYRGECLDLEREATRGRIELHNEKLQNFQPYSSVLFILAQ
jgi:hypothetical protein